MPSVLATPPATQRIATGASAGIAEAPATAMATTPTLTVSMRAWPKRRSSTEAISEPAIMPAPHTAPRMPRPAVPASSESSANSGSSGDLMPAASVIMETTRITDRTVLDCRT